MDIVLYPFSSVSGDAPGMESLEVVLILQVMVKSAIARRVDRLLADRALHSASLLGQ
jgi:hypothetical protein